jgi:hypothetical protein
MGAAGSAPPAVVNLICVKIAWMGKTIASMEQPFHAIHVMPEPEHPKGRKGLVMASAWRQMATEDDAGMLVLDSDVAIEPTDLLAMVHHIGRDRDAVWTAPVRLWPRSTHLPSWVWGHRRPAPEGASPEEALRLWQTDIDDPEWFTFCFTYLPRRLIDEAVAAGLTTWHYPYVDRNMHLLAKDKGIPVRVVRGGCHPRHINF